MSKKINGRVCAMSALGLDHGNAICYSGYREGQSPHSRTFPSYDEIREDLLILAKNWEYVRLYDCSPHAETVLKVIRNEGLKFKIMLGLDMAAEMSNPHCPWGAEYSDEVLDANRQSNNEEVHRLIDLSNAFDDIVFIDCPAKDGISTVQQISLNFAVDWAAFAVHNCNDVVE